MKNELQIKPLRKFTVSTDDGEIDVFTGDEYYTDGPNVIFLRTGNKIREYFGGALKVVTTPVEDDFEG